MKYASLLLLLLCLIGSLGSKAQSNQILPEEGRLYAQTKQMSQFFHRFNAEEDVLGKSLSPDQKQWHDPALRQGFMKILFDASNTQLPSSRKDSFCRTLAIDSSQHINFYNKDWYAELSCVFTFQGKSLNVLLFLSIEAVNGGYKWVIVNAWVPSWSKQLNPRQQDSARLFIHPMSHELDFMNVSKLLGQTNQLQTFIAKDRDLDHLSILTWYFNNKELKLSTLGNLKFHFLQIDGWYFSVSWVERSGYNTGWLIDNLYAVNTSQKQSLKWNMFRQ